jgi:3-dehydroquinate synthase
MAGRARWISATGRPQARAALRLPRLPWEAVATGILLDSIYAREHGWISPAEFAEIHEGLTQSGFALWADELDQRDADGGLRILAGLRDFQEHLGGELSVTFPRGLGARHEVHEIDLAKMERALQELRLLSRAAT